MPIVPMVTRENCREAVAKISRQRRVKISWQRINFSAEERAAEERGQAADCIILIEVHVIVIWSWVLARIP